MKLKAGIFLVIILVILGGLLAAQSIPRFLSSVPEISGTGDILPDEQGLRRFGMEISGLSCRTEDYETGARASLAQYSFCNFTITSLNGTEVILEVKKYTNMEDRTGAYQYESSHLFGQEGLISENEYGDLSRFRVSSEDDYMGHLNNPGVYYYHLWICKDLYLIHVTSSGTVEAEDEVASVGEHILSQFSRI